MLDHSRPRSADANQLAAVPRRKTDASAGKMVWFNDRKNVGVIDALDEGRLSVHGDDFLPGHLPEGRCKGLSVTFTIAGDEPTRRAIGVSVVPEPVTKRARLHRRGAG